MKDAIQERIDVQHGAIDAKAWDVVKTKESAIVHFGHSLSHRVSNIIQFFDNCTIGESDRIAHVAKNASVFLNDLVTLLQAANIHSLDALLRHEKRGKFLLDVPPDSPPYPLSRILEECRLIASCPRRQEYKGTKDLYWVELQFKGLERLSLGVSALPGHPNLRMNHQLLTPILAELFDRVHFKKVGQI